MGTAWRSFLKQTFTGHLLYAWPCIWPCPWAAGPVSSDFCVRFQVSLPLGKSLGLCGSLFPHPRNRRLLIPNAWDPWEGLVMC